MTDSGSKPNRMIVSLQVGGVFFALANIICVAILAHAYLAVKLEPKTIEVKGSAKKNIESDLMTWNGTFTVYDPDLSKAYDKLKGQADQIAAFIKRAGIAEGEVKFSSIRTTKKMVKEVIQQAAPAGQPAPPPVVMDTSKVEFFILSQTVTIESKDMKKVPEISRNITSLIKDGIEIDSGEPEYLYTKLSELKINMLADATKDATTRAEQIVNNAHGKLGKLVEAKMGVMQINPKGSSATSAEGNNDTTSFEKEITSVVTAKFEVD